MPIGGWNHANKRIVNSIYSANYFDVVEINHQISNSENIHHRDKFPILAPLPGTLRVIICRIWAIPLVSIRLSQHTSITYLWITPPNFGGTTQGQAKNEKHFSKKGKGSIAGSNQYSKGWNEPLEANGTLCAIQQRNFTQNVQSGTSASANTTFKTLHVLLKSRTA